MSARGHPARIGAIIAANLPLTAGIVLLILLIGFSVIGSMVYNVDLAEPLSVRPNQPPGPGLLFGSDAQGRDLMAAIILGSIETLRLGLAVGAISVGIGAILGFSAGYLGRRVDAMISGSVDVALAIPPILLLVVYASASPGGLNTTEMIIALAALAWAKAVRQIRSQVLVMREAAFVRTAQISGSTKLEIMFLEMLPNLLPYLAASFVLAASTGILASIGIEALGLGAQDDTTLGLIIFWMMYSSAFVRGMWWWIVIPIGFLAAIFVALYLISIGLDRFSNPASKSA